MDKISFGKRLNRIRKEQELTSAALSKRCGLHPVFIRQIESATRLPSLPVFIRLCNSLHISPNYLLADSLDVEATEQEQLEIPWNKLQELTPWQTDMVLAMTDTMIEKMQK